MSTCRDPHGPLRRYAVIVGLAFVWLQAIVKVWDYATAAHGFDKFGLHLMLGVMVLGAIGALAAAEKFYL